METREHLKKVIGIDCNLNSHEARVLKIADVLRTEAMEKSSDLLEFNNPRIKIENLSAKGINAKMLKIQTKFRGNFTNQQRGAPSQSVSTNELQIAKSDNAEDGEISVKIKSDSEFESSDENFPEDVDTLDQAISNEPDDTTQYYTRDDIVDSNSGGKASPRNDNNSVRTSPSQSPIKDVKRKWSINPDTGKYKCGRCQLEFAGCSGVSMHFDNVHKGMKFVCLICKKGFTQKCSLRVHQRTASCGKKRNSFNSSTGKYKCSLCEKEFAWQNNLYTHFKSVHKGAKFVCQVCKKVFGQKDNLKRHQKTKRCGRNKGQE